MCRGSASEVLKHSGQFWKWAFLEKHQFVQAPSGPMRISHLTVEEALRGTWHGSGEESCAIASIKTMQPTEKGARQ